MEKEKVRNNNFLGQNRINEEGKYEKECYGNKRERAEVENYNYTIRNKRCEIQIVGDII